MRIAGVFLIFAAVALRGAVIFSADHRFGAVIGLLTIYGFFLVLVTWIIHRKPASQTRYTQTAYLLLQSIIVLWLLDVSSYEDFFALLFIPISLDAVAFFGKRIGFIWITAFTLAILSIMLFSEEGPLFGLTMGGLYSGVCFLFGGYASQVLKAESASAQNKRMFNELKSVHRQLKKYADQVEHLAVEQERNRLARELHDSVTQTVFSMNLAVQSARLLLDKEPLRTSGQLLRLEELSANALKEIQSLVSQLSPRSLSEEGLPSALRRLADERQGRDGLRVSLEIQGESPLSETETMGLYSIVNEALTNVVKHSNQREALIRLNLHDGLSSLTVEDHGQGFNSQTVSNQRGHLGLIGMSERAREIGWSFSIKSETDKGTYILVTQNQAGRAG